MRFHPADARAYVSGRDLLGDTIRSIDLEIQHGTYDRRCSGTRRIATPTCAASRARR